MTAREAALARIIFGHDDLLAHGERTDVLPLYVNILVVREGNEVAIFDGGFGPGKNPNSGWVGESLASIGIATDTVTHAFLSHAHIDHIGGFVTGNTRILPNAAVHCLKEEIDFWRSPVPDFSWTLLSCTGRSKRWIPSGIGLACQSLPTA